VITNFGMTSPGSSKAGAYVCIALGIFLGLPFVSLSLLYADDAPSRMTPVTKDEVHRAVLAEFRARGVPGDALPTGGDIELPAAVPATVERRLRVTASCWNETLALLQFRLECAQAGQCLPFFAFVRGPRPEAAESCQSAPNVRAARPRLRKPVVRAGDRATVVFRGPQVRLTTTVTCLDRGSEGDIVRVKNQDGRVFRARVSTASLLEALP